MRSKFKYFELLTIRGGSADDQGKAAGGKAGDKGRGGTCRKTEGEFIGRGKMVAERRKPRWQRPASQRTGRLSFVQHKTIKTLMLT